MWPSPQPLVPWPSAADSVVEELALLVAVEVEELVRLERCRMAKRSSSNMA